ncbi:MAG: hypothetical protein FD123_4108 [Bacteroidetes bacterium]|nr:MAG: hypothetical protein FD123_4108 [Bacteroidota bacterium]
MAKKQVAAQKEIDLRLTIEEINTVLESLGQMPFMRVYRIIEKIHIQASGSNNAAAKKPKT